MKIKFKNYKDYIDKIDKKIERYKNPKTSHQEDLLIKYLEKKINATLSIIHDWHKELKYKKK